MVLYNLNDKKPNPNTNNFYVKVTGRHPKKCSSGLGISPLNIFENTTVENDGEMVLLPKFIAEAYGFEDIWYGNM